MAKKEITYEEIMRSFLSGEYKPIYYLMGEESYYMDLISEHLANNILSEIEKEFNLSVLYGADVTVPQIINLAKQYPMMSAYKVVVVKEAQNLRNLDELSFYLQKPLSSSILVFCHKHGVLDRRKKIYAELEKCGLVFESKKLKDTQIPGFIVSYLKQKQIDIDTTCASLLTDSVGTDLSRLTGELEKLVITLPSGNRRITADHIEKNVGISKEYNNFELRNALIEKDILKANRIIKYFEDNPKSNPIQMTLSLLFSFFSNLMLAYYATDKSDQGIAQMLGLRSPWQSRDYMVAMKKYSGMKVMQIIGEIRYCDARSKGVENSSAGNGELLKELLFKILH